MDKDKLFYTKWASTRKKGRNKYIISRGLLFASIVYIVWVVTTIMFDRHKFDESFFKLRFVYYGIIYLLTGFVISISSWKGNESRYKNLIQYYENKNT